MLKEFKIESEQRIISINLNDITLIEHCVNEYNGNTKYEVHIMTKSGFARPICNTKDYQECINFYNQLLEAHKESQSKIDTEKRLKSYIENIDNQIAKEVKKYFDKITGKL